MPGPTTPTKVFHLTAAVRERDATVAELGQLFGATVLHTDEGEIFGADLRRAMVWIGDTLLEVIEPCGPSPFQTFVERFGGGLHSLGLCVADASATQARLAEHGVEVAVRFSDEMFATRTAATAGLALQWSTQEVPDDPRTTGKVPPAPPDALIRPQRLASVVALVEVPAQAAAHLALALGTSPTFYEGDDADAGWATVAIGDCSLALHGLAAPEAARAAWGVVNTRPRLWALGLQVADVAASTEALRHAGVPAIGVQPAGVVLDPGALSIPVVLRADLLAGDPRSTAGT